MHVRVCACICLQTSTLVHAPLLRGVAIVGEATRVSLVLVAILLPWCDVAEAILVDVHALLGAHHQD